MYTFKILYLCLFLFFVNTITSQNKFFEPTLNYTADIATNLSGSKGQFVNYMGLVEAGFELDSEAAKLWNGGSFRTSFFSIHGKGHSHTSLHDVQIISNIEAGNHPFVLWELWYQQQFGRLRIKGGLQSFDSEYMVYPSGAEFSGSSYGYPPTISLNYPMPAFPVSGLGLFANYQIDDYFQFQASIYNGSVSDLEDDKTNTSWDVDIRKQGVLSTAEIKYSSDPSKHLSSTYGIGGVFQNKRISPFDEEADYTTTNYTLYGYGEHDVYKTSTKKAAAFAQISYAPKSKNIGYGYFSVGGVVEGLITSSSKDKVGVGFSNLYYHHIVDGVKKNRAEGVVEAFVCYEINKYLSVKPTVYLVAPSSRKAMTVALLRLRINIF